MANGETIATKEDQEIQLLRFQRAERKEGWITDTVRDRYWRQCVGWSVGRGFESDYLEAHGVSNLMRYNEWLRRRTM